MGCPHNSQKQICVCVYIYIYILYTHTHTHTHDLESLLILRYEHNQYLCIAGFVLAIVLATVYLHISIVSVFKILVLKPISFHINNVCRQE